MDFDQQDLSKEVSEMNAVWLEHCNRCHTALKSDTYTFDPKKPLIIFSPPSICGICKDDDYSADISTKKALPTNDNGLLCKCVYPGCEKEFFNRPSWYEKQQHIAKSGNPWMPVLIDKDKEKVAGLLNGNQELTTK